MTYLRLIAKRSVNSFQFEGNCLFSNKFMIVVQSNNNICEKKFSARKCKLLPSTETLKFCFMNKILK